MDGSQVGVLKKTDKVSLGRLLKCQDGGALETKVGLVVLSDLTNEALEGKLADQKLSALLVASDLTKGDSSRSVSVGFLHSSSSWGGFTSCLGGELLARSLSSGGFTCGLLSTGHFLLVCLVV